MRHRLLTVHNGSAPASPLLTSLVAYYKLADVSDSAGTSTLTNNNTVTFSAGKVGNAATFASASSQDLSCADNAALSMGDIDFTLAGWAKISSKSGNKAIISKWDAVSINCEYLIRHEAGTDRIIFYVDNGAGSFTGVTASTFGAPSLNTWFFFVAWHDSVANTINIQINNGTANSAAYSAGSYNSTKSFRIGSGGGGANYWDGSIDEIAVWKRTLDASERALLYNSGTGTTYPFP